VIDQGVSLDALLVKSDSAFALGSLQMKLLFQEKVKEYL